MLAKANYKVSLKYMKRQLTSRPETMKSGQNGLCFDLCDLDLWPTTSKRRMDITYNMDNNILLCHGDPMTGTYSKRCDGQTDRQTDRQTYSYRVLLSFFTDKNTVSFVLVEGTLMSFTFTMTLVSFLNGQPIGWYCDLCVVSFSDKTNL